MDTVISDIEILSKKLSLDEIAELIPGWLHLNNTIDFGLEYMSPKMQRDFKTTIKEVKSIGVSYLYNRIHQETSERVVPQLIELVESGDRSKILSFYQYIKLPEKDFEWFLTTSKLFNDVFVISTTIPLSVLMDFDKHIIDVLNENIFLKLNINKYYSLTKREKEIIHYLIQGSSNTVIARELNVSEYTIKTHRQKIYKKLEISNICDLVKFSNLYGLK